MAKNAPRIDNVHVDHVSHNGTRAAAGFNFDGARYHVWIDIDPKAFVASLSDSVLHKNQEGKRHEPLNACAARNAPLLVEMWKQINERELIRIALQRDELARAAEARRLETERRRAELSVAAIYEIGATIDGKSCTVLCDEQTARVVLPSFRGIADDDNTVYCRDLVNGSFVACFIPPEVVS